MKRICSLAGTERIGNPPKKGRTSSSTSTLHLVAPSSRGIGVLPIHSPSLLTMALCLRTTPITNTSLTMAVHGRTSLLRWVCSPDGRTIRPLKSLFHGRPWVHPHRLIFWSTPNGKTQGMFGHPSHSRILPVTTAQKPSPMLGTRRTSQTPRLQTRCLLLNQEASTKLTMP